jgi:hypothetical protein
LTLIRPASSSAYSKRAGPSKVSRRSAVTSP